MSSKGIHNEKGERAVLSTTTVTRTTPQASVELMIDLIPIDLIIQKWDSQHT